MDIAKETLTALRDALPYGSMGIIAKEAGLSLGYTCKILAGERPITNSNLKIVTIAQRIVKEDRERSLALTAEIKNDLK